MAVITRLYNFTNTTVRDDSKVDDELNNIISYLDGSSADELVILVDDDIEPPLTLGSLSKNPVFTVQVSSSTKVYFPNKNGSVESLISTGTAPFDISSTTKCTNLNAHYLDGIDGEKFNSEELTDQFFLGNLIIEKLTTGSNNLSVLQDGDILKLRRSSDNDSILEIQDFNQQTRVLSLPADLNVKVEYDPFEEESSTNNTDFDVLRYTDLLETDDILFFSFVQNALTGAQTNKVIAAWICGMPINGLAKIRKLTCYKGTTTGTVDITLYKNGSSVAVLNIPSGADIDAPHSIDCNIECSLGDVFVTKATTSGSQNYILTGCIGRI